MEELDRVIREVKISEFAKVKLDKYLDMVKSSRTKNLALSTKIEAIAVIIMIISVVIFILTMKFLIILFPCFIGLTLLFKAQIVKQKYDDEKYEFDFVKRSDIYIECIFAKNILDIDELIENIPTSFCPRYYKDNMRELIERDFIKLHKIGVFESENYINEVQLLNDMELTLGKTEKIKDRSSKRRKAKFLLFIIGTLGVVLNYPNFVLIYFIFGILLLNGSEVIKYLYIAVTVVGVGLEVFEKYNSGGILYDKQLMYSLAVALFICCTLLFSKDVKEYITYRENRKSYNDTFFGLLRVGLIRKLIYRSFKPKTIERKDLVKINYEGYDKLHLGLSIPFNVIEETKKVENIFNQSDYDLYIESLLKEIDVVGNMSIGRKEVSTLNIFVGTYLPQIEDLEKIVIKINEHFVIKKGIYIKLYPTQVNIENLKALKELGVKEVSIIVNSFNKKFDESLGNVDFNWSDIKLALEVVEFQNLRIQLNFNLPNIEVADLIEDFEKAFSMGFDTVDLVEYYDKSREYTNKRPNRQVIIKLLTEISTYCKERGYVNRKRLSYSKNIENKSIIEQCYGIAFGSNMIQFLEDIRVTKSYKVQEYNELLAKNQLPYYQITVLNLRYNMMLHIIREIDNLEIDKKSFDSKFGVSIEKALGFELFLAKVLGYIVDDGDKYLLTVKGFVQMSRYL